MCPVPHSSQTQVLLESRPCTQPLSHCVLRFMDNENGEKSHICAVMEDEVLRRKGGEPPDPDWVIANIQGVRGARSSRISRKSVGGNGMEGGSGWSSQPGQSKEASRV